MLIELGTVRHRPLLHIQTCFLTPHSQSALQLCHGTAWFPVMFLGRPPFTFPLTISHKLDCETHAVDDHHHIMIQSFIASSTKILMERRSPTDSRDSLPTSAAQEHNKDEQDNHLDDIVRSKISVASRGDIQPVGKKHESQTLAFRFQASAILCDYWKRQRI
jgi:hypothetical protein